MKVLFLDIDGVVNGLATFKRHKQEGNPSHIDEILAQRVQHIVLETGCDVVLSSSWRGSLENEQEIAEKVIELYDVTPRMHRPIGTGMEYCERGKEIKAWLDQHPEVTKYAILDDDSDMLPEQQENFFHTDNAVGLTQEVAERVIAHFNA